MIQVQAVLFIYHICTCRKVFWVAKIRISIPRNVSVRLMALRSIHSKKEKGKKRRSCVQSSHRLGVRLTSETLCHPAISCLVSLFFFSLSLRTNVNLKQSKPEVQGHGITSNVKQQHLFHLLWNSFHSKIIFLHTAAL